MNEGDIDDLVTEAVRLATELLRLKMGPGTSPAVVAALVLDRLVGQGIPFTSIRLPAGVVVTLERSRDHRRKAFLPRKGLRPARKRRWLMG